MNQVASSVLLFVLAGHGFGAPAVLSRPIEDSRTRIREPVVVDRSDPELCVPRLTAPYVTGLVHEVNPAVSSPHSNRATVPLSVPVKRNVTLSEGVLPPFVSDLPRPSTAPRH
jgi:hypothetical protein